MPINNAKAARGLDHLPQGSGHALRSRRRILEAARERRRQLRTGGRHYEPAISKPKPIANLADLDESNFFYFAYPAPPALREAGDDLQPGDQIGASRAPRSCSPACSDATRGRQAGDAGGDLPPAALPLPRDQSRFDGVSLHPYPVGQRNARRTGRRIHEVLVEITTARLLHHRDGMGIAETISSTTPSSRGPRGQVKQMRRLLRIPARQPAPAEPRGVYWFSWKNLRGTCDFCDSVGFFHEGNDSSQSLCTRSCGDRRPRRP